jgi:probable F420-dependent oxidoreductase
MKPFRFGVQVSQVDSASQWRDKARKLEDLGFSTLFMPDHFGQELAPLPAIAMAAAHTTTLRVGSLVFDNDYKHPAILAKEAATIDLLSDGRLELGIGAGWMRTDYDQLGLPYDPPAVRVDRFEEALQVIKQCFTGEQFTFHGEHYRISDYASWPKPVQQPRPPLLIGGGGKRVLSIAAREADIVGINPNLRAGEIGIDAATDSLREQSDR